MKINKHALHQGTLKHIPTDEFLLKAAENNFKNLSLWLPSINEFLNSGHSLEEIKHIVYSHNLNIIEVSPFYDWIAMQKDNQEAKVAEFHQICNIAKELQAEFICAPALGKNTSFELAIANLLTLADIASAYKVKIAVEFVPDQYIDNLLTAWKFIQTVNRDNVGILLDTVLFFQGASKLIDLDMVPIEKIFLVHLADLENAPPNIDTLSLVRNYRTFPSVGKLDLTSLITKLQQKGYVGYYSLEILNKEFPNINATSILQKIWYQSLLF